MKDRRLIGIPRQKKRVRENDSSLESAMRDINDAYLNRRLRFIGFNREVTEPFDSGIRGAVRTTYTIDIVEDVTI